MTMSIMTMTPIVVNDNTHNDNNTHSGNDNTHNDNNTHRG